MLEVILSCRRALLRVGVVLYGAGTLFLEYYYYHFFIVYYVIIIFLSFWVFSRGIGGVF